MALAAALVVACLLVPSALAAPTIKRDPTQVSLASYTFTNGVLAGSITVQNLAYSKQITVNYAVGASQAFASGQNIPAKYASAASTSGFETWTFSAPAEDVTAFYIAYAVSGQTYYAPGNEQNYQVTSSPTAPTTPTKSTAPGPAPTSAIPAASPASHPSAGAGGRSDVLLQGFDWTSSTNSPGTWWSTINSQISSIQGIFSLIWLPPVTDSESDQGYLPRQWNVLDSKYGSTATLTSLVSALKNAGIQAVADIVINHRVGVTGWGDFSNPAFPDNNAAICNGDEWAQHGGHPTGAADTGFNYAAARDLDHTNTDVQNEIEAYLRNLQSIGFAGWRYDFVLGYAGRYVEQYNAATSPVFSVGEHWDTLYFPDSNTHRSLAHQWILDAGSSSAAFDFTTKGMLGDAIQMTRFDALSMNGQPCGLIGIDPAHAVTFVDNHDTGPSNGGGQNIWPFPSDSIMLGYAYILTHPGVPSVYWYHYFTLSLKSTIDPLIAARKAAGVTSTSPVTIALAQTTTYAAYVQGSVSKLAVKIGSGSWSPAAGFQIVGSGNNWAVWTGI
ncbi:hypothetical protein HKX48_002216 [Thoreauomyces humboldtii]|nr:hypothetical protein HKX48_002216 [Thoreauomyces humboldtii]